MDKKRQSFLLTIITTVFTLLWFAFFLLSSFSDVLDEPGFGLTLLLMLFAFFSFIFPFAGLYLWYSDNFRLKSKYLITIAFSLTPWIIVLLVSIRNTILEWLFG
ncbi:hypothetical protein MG290_02445 [Flavobacterium sp. CBA20B-1]|uniref:hypothetical protein n=1 Tax=unclassified Flavobacterium TaxID=196869 RepID=UPI0022241050|nr:MULTISPECIES: hypothetical protein [unclassified Flavobacterium]WCM42552.1 hypothetical protein MG290_02445 [Flavobacterium sp. CBA20B-1]